MWLQKRRQPGLWVQCDDCSKWRYLPHILDNHQLPDQWYCTMNPDKTMSCCSVPETPIPVHDEEDLIYSEYSAGSLVWARVQGWPWWPAMVDDCPDAEQFYWLDGFSDIPTHYNVVFFDKLSVTRAWIDPENLKPYSKNKTIFKHLLKGKKYGKRIQDATFQANDAEILPLADRLAKYSFIVRYKGPVSSPKKILKKDLEKFQNQLKRKYNIDFSIESDGEDSHSSSEYQLTESFKNKNIITLGSKKPNGNKKSNKRKANKADAMTEVVIDSSKNNPKRVAKGKTNKNNVKASNKLDAQSHNDRKMTNKHKGSLDTDQSQNNIDLIDTPKDNTDSSKMDPKINMVNKYKVTLDSIEPHHNINTVNIAKDNVNNIEPNYNANKPRDTVDSSKTQHSAYKNADKEIEQPDSMLVNTSVNTMEQLTLQMNRDIKNQEDTQDFDNDTSTTYAPPTRDSLQMQDSKFLTESDDIDEMPKLRIVSPLSVDFDF